MPVSPKPRCRVCGQLHCTDPAHIRKPFANVQGNTHRKLARPDYRSAKEQARRKATVTAFMDEHGFMLPDGKTGARCPDCGKVRTRLHLTTSQRAMVAEKLANLRHGGDRSKTPNGDLVSQDEAAALLNVSP